MKPIQRGIVIVCAMGILLCGLFPPWLYMDHRFKSASVEKSAGYHLIFQAPGPEFPDDIANGIKLDIKRLAVQWVGIAMVGVACFTALKSRPS